MFQRSTLILLIVAAALGSAIYWFEIKQGQERESAERNARLLFPEVSPTAIDELAFETADEFEVRFERVNSCTIKDEQLRYIIELEQGSVGLK
jgi:hypothetical protein